MTGVPELPPGLTPDLGTWSPEEIENYAKKLAETPRGQKIGETKILNWLLEMQAKGIELTPSILDKLLSGEPILFPPKTNLDDLLSGGYFDEVSGGNPFLKASLLTLFTIIFMEVTAQMAEIAVTEAEIIAETILLLHEIGMTKANLRMIAAQAESDMEKAAMVAAIFSAAAAGVSLVAGKIAKKGGGEYGAMWAGGIMTATSTLGSSIGQIIEHATKMMKLLEKGEAEAALEYLNTITSTFERRMSAAGEASKEMRDLVQKFLDAFNQMAHSIQTGFGIDPQHKG